MSTSSQRKTAPFANPVDVIYLQLRHECEIESGPFAALLESKGMASAEDAVFRALEEMANRIENIRCAWQDADNDDIAELAPRLAGIARGLGFASLAAAADGLTHASLDDDAVALAATFGRVDRAFDGAVAQAWAVFDVL